MNASNKVGSGGVDAMILLVDVGSLTAFDPKGDLNGISQRWKRWKRSFASYLTGKGVTDDKQKRALLLHAAGVDVQIYFTMVSEEEIFSFTTTMKALDDYFVPKSTVPFERHFFKQFDKLVMRQWTSLCVGFSRGLRAVISGSCRMITFIIKLLISAT